MSQVIGRHSLRRAKEQDVGMETSDPSCETFRVQIAADEIQMGHPLGQAHAKVKRQQMRQLSDVRQRYFEMAKHLRVAILIGLVN